MTVHDPAVLTCERVIPPDAIPPDAILPDAAAIQVRVGGALDNLDSDGWPAPPPIGRPASPRRPRVVRQRVGLRVDGAVRRGVGAVSALAGVLFGGSPVGGQTDGSTVTEPTAQDTRTR